MTAQNHALTGAVIGLSVGNPLIALPLAFLSHFVCDAIPHYDMPGPVKTRLSSKRFVYEYLVVGAALCLLIVLLLAFSRPEHWLTAALAAFAAASPDLFWIPRFIYNRRNGHDRRSQNRFLQFHSFVQWKTGPHWFWLEAAWFMGFGFIFISRLWK